MTSTASNPDPDVTRMAEAIKQYLNKHPRAADTLEGIIYWWLLRHRYEKAAALVNEALELLVRQDVLIKITPQGGQTIYTLKRE
jgi:hypothetical protein